MELIELQVRKKESYEREEGTGPYKGSATFYTKGGMLQVPLSEDIISCIIEEARQDIAYNAQNLVDQLPAVLLNAAHPVLEAPKPAPAISGTGDYDDIPF